MIYLAANFYVRTLASIVASMASMSTFLASEWQVLASIGGLPQDCLIVSSGITKVLLASMASMNGRLIPIRAYSQNVKFYHKGSHIQNMLAMLARQLKLLIEMRKYIYNVQN